MKGLSPLHLLNQRFDQVNDLADEVYDGGDKKNSFECVLLVAAFFLFHYLTSLAVILLYIIVNIYSIDIVHENEHN